MGGGHRAAGGGNRQTISRQLAQYQKPPRVSLKKLRDTEHNCQQRGKAQRPADGARQNTTSVDGATQPTVGGCVWGVVRLPLTTSLGRWLTRQRIRRSGGGGRESCQAPTAKYRAI